MFKAPEEEPRTAEDQGQRERIAKGPGEFGHELEIHPVDAGDRGRHREDRRPGGELPRDHALTLLFEHAVGLDHRGGDVAQSVEAIFGALHMVPNVAVRSEEHTSELQSLMRISYAVFCLKKNKKI